MVNEYYNDRSTGEQVQVVKEETNFLVLNNNVRIKKDIFQKRYEPAMNPDAFLNQSPLFDAINQLKNIDPNQIRERVDDDRTTIKYKPATVLSDTSRSEVAVKQPQFEDTDGIVLTPQQKNAMLLDWKRKNPNMPEPIMQDAIPQLDEGLEEYEMPKPGEGGIKKIENTTTTTTTTTVSKKEEPKVDPLQMMFSMFKSNYPVKISITLDEMIANPAFIGMIQENVDADAVEYYTKIIMDKIMKEPLKLKTEIYNQLKTIVDYQLKGAPHSGTSGPPEEKINEEDGK